MNDDILQLRAQLLAAAPDQVYSALIAIGKKGTEYLEAHDLRDDVVPFLGHVDPHLRGAAIRVLGFYWELPGFQETASRMIDQESDSEPRAIATMAWASYWRDSRSPDAMRRLYGLLTDETNDQRVRGAALDGMAVVAGLQQADWPVNTDTSSTDRIDWSAVGRMLASCGVEVDLPSVSPEALARLGVTRVTHDWGSANNPSSSYGRLLLSFKGDVGLVSLEQQRGNKRRVWYAILPTATWNHVVDTMIRYQFPRPVTDAEPRVPGSSGATISWERDGQDQHVVLGGRTADYSDVNRIAMSVIEQMAPGLLDGEPGNYRFPSTVIEAPYELEPSTI